MSAKAKDILQNLTLAFCLFAALAANSDELWLVQVVFVTGFLFALDWRYRIKR